MDAIVVDNGTLVDFIQRLITTHASPSTLVICSSQHVFLQQLLSSIQSLQSANNDSVGNMESTEYDTFRADAPHPLLVPTLGMLALSRTLNVAFCSSLPSLRAFLSRHYEGVGSISDDSSNRALVFIGLLSLHRDTASWSAQGLSRTFAAAVEAAHWNNQRLIIFEPDNTSTSVADGAADATNAEEGMEVDTNVSRSSISVWEQQVSILNITTRSFGAGERGWVGRTVKVRQVAERWCRFQSSFD